MSLKAKKAVGEVLRELMEGERTLVKLPIEATDAVEYMELVRLHAQMNKVYITRTMAKDNFVIYKYAGRLNG